MGDLQSIGNLKQQKPKEVFKASYAEGSEESIEKKSGIGAGTDVTHKQGEIPAEKLGAMVDSNISEEELEMNPQFSEYKSTLPIAMQGLSVSAIRTYFKMKNNVHDKSSADYLKGERAQWVASFKDKLSSTRQDAFQGSEEDEYQTKTFSQVVEELRGHWNIKPGTDYTNFKNAVLEFEELSQNKKMDIEEYSNKYRQTINFINIYIDTHEGAKSLWGKKRLRMAKSLRAKMQYSMDPDKFFLSKFEDLGAIEIKDARHVESHVNKAPDFNEMSKEAGAIGASAGKFLTTEIKGTDLTQKTETGYEYKPIMSTVLTHTNIPDSPIVASNVSTMYDQVQKQNQSSYKGTALTPGLFIKSVIVSTITQKIADAKNLVLNIKKIKEDTKKRIEEEKIQKAEEVTNLIREREKKLDEYNDIDQKIEAKDKELEIQRRPYMERINELQREADTFTTQKEDYKKEFNAIKDDTTKEDQLNSPDYKLNKEIATLEKMGDIPENATIEEIEKQANNVEGYKPSKDLTYIKQQYEEKIRVSSLLVPDIEEKQEILKTFDEKIKEIDEKIAAKKKADADPVEQENAKKSYESLKEKVDNNPVAAKQRDMIEQFEREKTAAIRKLFTGEGGALLEKYDKTRIGRAEKKAYTDYYNKEADAIKASLNKRLQKYAEIVESHNVQAEVFNKVLEDRIRKDFGLLPRDEIPADIIMFKMQKMEVDAPEIKKALTYKLPKAEDILNKKTRQTVINGYETVSEPTEEETLKRTSIDEDFNSYKDNMEQINSRDFYRFNAKEKKKEDVQLKALMQDREKLVWDRVEPQGDLDMYLERQNYTKGQIEALREQYRTAAIKDMGGFVSDKLEEKKKQLEDEKAKVKEEKQKALDEVEKKINEANDKLDEKTFALNGMRERMAKEVGTTDELKMQRAKIRDEYNILHEKVKQAQTELTKLENGDELVAIQTDIVEGHKQEYQNELKKLSLMNEALSNFFTASELMDFQLEWDDDFEELEDVHKTYLRRFREGNVTFGKEAGDFENKYYMVNMKDYIREYCKIKEKRLGINITDDDINMMVDAVMKNYHDLNKNINAA